MDRTELKEIIKYIQALEPRAEVTQVHTLVAEEGNFTDNRIPWTQTGSINGSPLIRVKFWYSGDEEIPPVIQWCFVS